MAGLQKELIVTEGLADWIVQGPGAPSAQAEWGAFFANHIPGRA